MYITAHRVQKPNTNVTGINGFLHRHQPELTVPEIPDARALDAFLHANPGELHKSHEIIPAGGNFVLSYLDVLSTDVVSEAAVRASLQEFRKLLHEPGYPLVRPINNIVLRFGTTRELEGAEDLEFDELSEVVLNLLQDS